MRLTIEKTIGAFLIVLILVLGLDEIIDGWILPVPLAVAMVETTETPASQKPSPTTQPPALEEDIVTLIAAATPGRGAKIAKKCTACHTFDKGGPNKVGPNLHNVLGAAAARVGSYKYSDALVAKKGTTWSYENLNTFLKKPRLYAKGTKMTFAGIKKAADRAAVIRYMMEYADSPPPLPQG